MKIPYLKFIRLFFTFALVTIAALIIVIAILLGNHQSSAWFIQWINEQELGISMQYQQGNFLEGIDINHLHYQDDTIAIDINTLKIAIDYRCLIQAKVCLDYLEANTVDLQLITSHKPQKHKPTESNQLPELNLPFSAEVKYLHLNKLRYHDTNTDKTVDNISLQAAMARSTLKIKNVHAEYQNIKMQASGQLTLHQHYPLHIIANLQDKVLGLDSQIEAKGNLRYLQLQAENNGEYAISADATLENIIQAMTLHIDIQSHKAITLNIDNNSYTLAPIKAHLSGDLDSLTLESQKEPFNWRHNAQVGAINTAVKAHWSAKNKSLKIQQLTAVSDIASVSLTAQFDYSKEAYQSWALEAVISALDLSQLNTDMEHPSQLAAKIQLNGGIKNYDLSTLSVQGRVFEGQGDINQHPIQYSATFSYKPQQGFSLNNLTLSSKMNQLEAFGDLTQDAPFNIIIDFNELAHLIPQTSGRLNGHAQLYSKNPLPAFNDITAVNAWINELYSSAELSLENLKYDAISLEHADLNIKINAFAQKESQLHINALNLNIAEQAIEKIHASINGSQLQHTIQINSNVTHISQIDIACTASLSSLLHFDPELSLPESWESDCYTFKLDPLFYSLPKLSNKEPIKLAIHSQPKKSYTVSLLPFCLIEDDRSNNIEICSNKTILINNSGLFDIDIKSNDIPLDTFSNFIDANLTLKGSANASLIGQWPLAEKKHLNFMVSADNSQGFWHENSAEKNSADKSNKAYLFTFDQLKTHIQLNDHQAIIHSLYSSEQLGNMTADFTVEDIQNSRRLQGELKMQQLMLSPLAQFNNEIKESAGEVNGLLTLSGNLDNPKMLGHVTLENGLLVTNMISNRFEDIQLNLDFSHNNADLQGQVNMDGNPLTTQGTLRWLDEKWRAQLNFIGKDLPLNLAPIKRASISPNIQLTIENETLSINGEIALSDTLIEMDQLPETAYSESEDVVFVQPEKSPNVSTQWQVQTDLKLLLQNNIKFKGFGADVDLRGNLHYLQQGNHLPMAQGEIFIDKGHYTFWGQRLEVTEGSFIFSNHLDNPDIKIQAIRDIKNENLIVGIKGYGPLQEPIFDVFSSKPMDNQTIMHYLITGRPPQKEAAEGTDLLSTALLSRSVSSAYNHTGNMAEKIGIQDFQMNTATSQDGTEVQLSGYIHDKVFIQYGMGLFDKSNTLTMRYQIFPQLFFETASGLDSTIDLIYSFEIKNK